MTGTIHGRIEAPAASRPDAQTLVLGDESLTYPQLDVRADRVAHVRRRGQRVAIYYAAADGLREPRHVRRRPIVATPVRVTVGH